MNQALKIGTTLLAMITLAPPVLADGGWVQETVALSSGWNLVWLDADPVPDDPEALFGGIDYDSVWSFVPGRLQGDSGAWVTYHRDRPAFLDTLHRVQGKRGYLIKAYAPGTLSVTGKPVLRATSFSGPDWNLFGTVFDGVPTAPTFNKFFSHPNVQGKVDSQAYRLVGGGYSSIPLSATMQSRAAYWLKATQNFPYGGPIATNAPLAGLQFGKGAYSIELGIEVPFNASARMVEVKAVPSVQPPAIGPTDAGTGNVSWLEFRDRTDPDHPVWRPLSAGTMVTVPANQTTASLEIRCVRNGREAATEDFSPASLYQGIIRITDANGSQLRVAAGMEIELVNGVWVGQARLTNVSLNSVVSNPSGLTDAKPLAMSLILALPGPEAPGSPMKLLDKAYVEVDRDGRTLKYRYNAILFHEPVTLAGSVGGNGTSGTLTGTVLMAADHALNPYRHRYNPEHRSGYATTRQVTLQFSATDPDPLNQSLGLAESVGDNELVGMYSEVINGVSLEPITVSGPFKLHRFSNTTDLLQAP